MQQESVDMDIPEEKIPKRASTEILEAERLEDLETCLVGSKGQFFFTPVLDGLGIMFIYVSSSIMFLSGHFMLIKTG